MVIIKKIKKKERSRNKILEAAIQILAIKGFDATSFQNIADHCEMTQQGVLVHFKNKHDLFLAILDKIQTEMYQNADSNFAPEDNWKLKLEKHFLTNVRVVRQRPERMQVFILLYYYCSFNESYKKVYQQILLKVRRRLLDYMKVKRGAIRFKISPKSFAEIFHAHLIGYLINSIAGEPSQFSEKEALEKVRWLIDSFAH